MIEINCNKCDYTIKEELSLFGKCCWCNTEEELENYNSEIKYNQSIIEISDIYNFKGSTRDCNDKYNKIRENIIGAIINKKIPDTFYKYSTEWRELREEINNYIDDLCNINNLECNSIECVHKAGRRNHYDFLIIINKNNKFNIEFKFNASCIDDTPQFVSPMKPSQYLYGNYEEYYYDNYFSELVNYFNELEKSNLEIPDKETYLKNIHSPKPIELKDIQDKYYKGSTGSSKYTGNEEDIKFYKRANELAQESIENFIENTNLNTKKLTNYLLDTQKNKIYMLCKNNSFKLEKVNLNNYKINSYKKEKNKYRYIATTKNNKEIKILLRWKNGNGIAYPAFQIS